MVTAIQEFLPNGQVNGYCHQELFSGYQRFENIFCCLLQVSQLLQLYFHLFVVKSLKTLNPPYFPQKILSQAGSFSHMTMVTEDFRLNGQWSQKVFSPMQWLAQWSRPSMNFPQWSAQWSWPSRKFPQWSMVTTFRNRPYGKAWAKRPETGHRKKFI